MSFIRPQAVLSGCECRGKGGAMGDLVDPTAISATGAPSGVDPIVFLRAHLNRYTAAGGAPIAFQIAPTPLPVIGGLDGDVASRALWVLTRRAGAADMAYADASTKALIKTVGSAWANPVAYVAKNLAAVTDVVRLYGDQNRLADAKGVPSMGPSLPISTPVLVVGLLALGYLATRKKGRRMG